MRKQIRRLREEKLHQQKYLAQQFTQQLLKVVPNQTTTIAAFLPMVGEPPIKDALQKLHRHGIKILVPIVVADHQLEWVFWSPENQHPISTLGIEEPTGQHMGADAFFQADIHLIPALAFDTTGHRLGQGGGYYDRLLSQVQDELRTPSYIGLVFEDEILATVPSQEHDARFSYILTEKGIREVKGVE